MFGHAAAVALLLVTLASAKVFERCELAKELLRLKADRKDLPTWVCIAKRESNFNTSAVGNLNVDGSGDHGIFQISDKFWCSPQGWACNIPCSLLEDDDISDDWKCARRIYNEHRRLSGNGFKAWVAYSQECEGDVSSYVDDCFQEGGGSEKPPAPVERDEERVIESYSAREGNLAEKVQVPEQEILKKNEPKKGKSAGRSWKPWTWEILHSN